MSMCVWARALNNILLEIKAENVHDFITISVYNRLSMFDMNVASSSLRQLRLGCSKDNSFLLDYRQ